MLPVEPIAAARRLAAIVSSSDDAIVSKDLTGIVTSWNAAAERMFGYDAAEMIGNSIRTIVPHDRQAEEDDVLARIGRGEVVDHFETLRRHKTGRMVPVSLTVSPMRDADGRIVGASKIARDITERKRTAERAAFLNEAARVLAASLDYKATLSAVVNLIVPSIADWCAIDVLTGTGTLQRLSVAHVDPTKVGLARVARERYEDPASPHSPSAVTRSAKSTLLSVVSDQMVADAAAGDEERVQFIRALGVSSYICVPLIAHGRTLGAVTLASSTPGREYGNEDLQFAEEIAYRVALAIDNAQAYEQARTANQLKDDFLATLSHELRTPLNAIVGYTRLLRSGLLAGEKQARGLDTLERNAASLSQIVEDVLDVSRIISGKIRLNVQPVDLPEVIRNAVDTILPAAEAKQIRVQVILDPQTTPVLGDAERLQQIIWNLVSNAVKFTPRGGAVRVALERGSAHAEIVVADTGMGIKPEFLTHVFERFRQADSSTTREHGGLGLGLAIVRHFTELHGGTVHAASDGEGKGATFRVVLPVAAVQHDPPPEEVRLRQTGPVLVPRPLAGLDGLRVLAVDDDADALQLVREVLESAGASVTVASSVAAALDRVKALDLDVMIVDIGLPVADGLQFIKEVRRMRHPVVARTPAAALTAYASSEDRVRSLEAGFQMHLAKPVDPSELVAAVRALARRSLGDETS